MEKKRRRRNKLLHSLIILQEKENKDIDNDLVKHRTQRKEQESE